MKHLYQGLPGKIKTFGKLSRESSTRVCKTIKDRWHANDFGRNGLKFELQI
jgi:hypothetical protein